MTFTVTVTPDPTKAARALTKAVPVPPTGTITVTDNGITLGTAPLVNGSATLTVKTLTTPGTHFIVASYSGDANNAAAQSTPFMQIVAMAANTASVPVPMLSEWWAKLLMSLMLLGCASLGVCMRRA
ncbi:hypothetical protein SDC9_136581 [bioreactor metagenome]|uniref:Bacterial Ig-like domain-containing protein n=1 Tax=bioreactor metagenome TaxID=1076179 RepID=A0A645DLN9_9ZZZZ